MVVLGIETSCDETAVALVNSDRKIIAEKTPSHSKSHQQYGGIVPEVSSRLHLDLLPPVTKALLAESRLKPCAITAIAVTAGPGLIGSLIVGSMFAQSLAAAWDKPCLAINHLQGHALTVRLTHDVDFPYLLFLTSGGHCQFLIVKGVYQYHLLGQTLDDAPGETFDKVARKLGFGYPGGPWIEQAARTGQGKRFTFPQPLRGRPGCDLSFSGLKTAVIEHIATLETHEESTKHDLCAGFQEAIARMMEERASHAIRMAREITPQIQTFVMAGGVAANHFLRMRLHKTATDGGLNFVCPPAHLCTDNGAMIAWAGLESLRQSNQRPQDCTPRPRWPLGEMR